MYTNEKNRTHNYLCETLQLARDKKNVEERNIYFETPLREKIQKDLSWYIKLVKSKVLSGGQW